MPKFPSASPAPPRGRVNWRLLGAGVLVVGLGALLFLAMLRLSHRRDPARHERLGTAALERGDAAAAVVHFRRALEVTWNTGNEGAALTHLITAYERRQVQTPQDAETALDEEMGFLLRLCNRQPANQVMAAKRLGMAAERAQWTGEFRHWHTVIECVEGLLKANSESALALKWRGIATLFREPSQGKAWQQARLDLERAALLLPEDADIPAHLALWFIAEASALPPEQAAAAAPALWRQAEEQVHRFARRRPADMQGRLNEVLVVSLIDALRHTPDPSQAGVLPLAERLAPELAVTGDPEQCRQFATVLLILDQSAGNRTAATATPAGIGERAAQFLTRALERHADDPGLWLTLGRIQRAGQRLAEARQCFAKAAAITPQQLSVAACRRLYMSRDAVFDLASLTLAEGEVATEPAVRKRLLSEAGELSATMQRLSADSPMARLLAGELAAQQDDPWAAVDKLGAAQPLGRYWDAERELWLGRMLRDVGESGAAAQHYVAAVVYAETRPDIRCQAALELAQILVRQRALRPGKPLLSADVLGQSTEARSESRQTHSKFLFRPTLTEPGAGPGTLATSLRQNVTRLETAPADPARERLRLPQLAALCLLLGDQDRAVTALVRHGAEFPDDHQAAVDQVAVELALNRFDAARQHAQALIAAVPANEALTLAAAKAQPAAPDPLSPRLPDCLRIGLNPDPAARLRALHQLHLEDGRAAAAHALLAAVPKETAPNPDIVAMQIEDALARNAVDEAQRVITAVAPGTRFGDPYALAMWQGRVALLAGRLPEARRIFAGIVDRRPEYSPARAWLGRTQLRSGNVAGAEISLRRAVALNPGNVTARTGLFVLYSQWGQRQAAIEQLAGALRAAPENGGIAGKLLDYVGRYGDPERALAVRSQLAERAPTDSANLRAIADLYQRQGKLDLAHTMLDWLQREAPGDLENWLAMARCLHKEGQAPQAVAMLMQHATDLGSAATVDDWCAVARFCRTAGATAQAIDAYQQAAKATVGDPAAARLELAALHMDARAFATALPLLEQAAADRPSPDTWNRWVVCLLELDRLADAQEVLQRWSTAGGTPRQVKPLEALLLAHEGKRTVAAATLSALVTEFPDAADLYLQRAQVQWANPEMAAQAQVKADLETALRLNPGLAPALQQLANWFIKAGRLTEAEEPLRRLLALQPEQPAHILQLAGLEVRRGRFAEARRALGLCAGALTASAAWHAVDAAVCAGEGRPDDELRALEKAWELAGGDLVHAVALGEAYLKRQDPARAAALVEAVAATGKLTPPMLALRGRARLVSGDRPGAETDLAAALATVLPDLEAAAQLLEAVRKIDPGFALELAEKAAAKSPAGDVLAGRLLLIQGDTERGIARLERLRTALPAADALQSEVLWPLAVAYHKSSRVAEAKNAYEALLLIQPKNAEALNNLAWLLAEDLKQPDKGLPLAERAVVLSDLNGGNSGHLDTLGHIHFAAGHPQLAVEYLQRSVRLQATAENQLHLAEVLIALNRRDEAAGLLDGLRPSAAAGGSTAGLAAEIERLDRLIHAKEGRPPAP